MKITEYGTVKHVILNVAGINGVAGRVVIGKSDGAKNFCMRLFEISPGGYTPKHSHDWEHEIFVHSGEGEVYGNGRRYPVKSGHVVFIPANEEHQILNKGANVLIFICLVPSYAPEM